MDSFIHIIKYYYSLKNFTFCPKNLRPELSVGFSQKNFLSFRTIQKNVVKEIYLLCFKIHLWAFLYLIDLLKVIYLILLCNLLAQI